MGQQQLLLLVLGVVVVGIAVIFGVYLFDERYRLQSGDDLLNRNVQIAQEAANWRGRSLIHGGGGGGSFDALATGGIGALGLNDTDANGQYAILSASGVTLEVVGVSTRYEGVGAYARIVANNIDSTAVRYDGSISLPGARP